ncbi:sensor histidine kinase [Microtetraspora niveoalba]|uniref:sensor histidine kinase n=1 Tax=Microtetraspora niveoalba TaxID=46175 RepID=UPI00082FDD94|nr:sensor histidine kinase [Microtetraspora niveoalba]
MHVTPPPLLKRVPPGVWTTAAWCAGLAFTFLIRVRLPGESAPTVVAGALLYRWDGLTFLVLATGLVLAGSALLPRRPLLSLALFLTASVIATLPLGVGEIPLAQFLAVDMTLYFIASTAARRTGIVAAAAALTVLAGYLTVRLLMSWTVGTAAELAVAMTAVIAWLVGHSVRQAREHAQTLIDRSTAQAVTAERLRISRELHDMVAHSIGIIALQAGAARRVIETQPEQARDALGEIETVGRETLSGLRRMLGALRSAEPERSPRTAPLDSAPGLADVDRLAATTTDAGVRVDVRWLGGRRPLPPDIDMSAYRIIQEAVTNVVRHAGTASCEVTVDFRDDELTIEVIDRGGGRGHAGGSGYGLVGMRERVGLLRGEFSAAPRPEGGFRVAARLPLPPAGTGH